MRTHAVAVLPFLLAALPDPLSAQGDGISWRTDLAAARALAAERHAPLFVAFRCER